MSTSTFMLLLVIGIGASVNAFGQKDLQPPPFWRGELEPQANTADICAECEQVLGELKKIVNNPDYEKKVVDTLKSICNILKPIKDQCLTRVDYLVNLLHELQGLVEDPRKTCTSLKLCKDGNSQIISMLSAITEVTSALSTNQHTTGAPTCAVCKLAVKQAKKILENPAGLDTLKAGLTKVCQIAYKNNDNCAEIVNQVMEKLVPILEQVLENPEGACTSLRFCESSDASLVTEIGHHPHLDRFWETLADTEKAFRIDVKCTACTAAVATGLTLIGTEKVSGQIADEVAKIVCNVFPKTLQAGCFDFLGLYGKTSIKLTSQSITAKEVCQAIKACAKTNLQEFVVNGRVTCVACNAASSILSNQLQQKDLQQDIINKVTGICKVIPNQVNSLRCSTMVETMFPHFITNVVALSLVPEICPAIHMCP